MRQNQFRNLENGARDAIILLLALLIFTIAVLSAALPKRNVSYSSACAEKLQLADTFEEQKQPDRTNTLRERPRPNPTSDNIPKYYNEPIDKPSYPKYYLINVEYWFGI